VVVFRVNLRNGRLTPSKKIEVLSPVCVTFVAAQ
jgi:6-phosphogluconolactonase (cycloisomerase 2 family)